MRQRSGPRRSASEKLVKDIQRAIRKQYSTEEKIRIVLDGLRGEDSITELCRREGISQGLWLEMINTSYRNFQSVLEVQCGFQNRIQQFQLRIW